VGQWPRRPTLGKDPTEVEGVRLHILYFIYNTQLTQYYCAVMMIGIIIQLVGVIIFALVAADFIWRTSMDRPARGKAPSESTATLQGRPAGYVRIPQPMRLLLIGMGISTFLVVIRFVCLFATPMIALTSGHP
jgi:RTA1 like protein